MLGLKVEGTMPLPFGTMYRFLFGSSQVKLIALNEEPPLKL